MASCIYLQLLIVILIKSILFDMHHHKTYMYINFQQNLVVDQSKQCTQIYLQKNRKLHKFATTNRNFEKINYVRHALLCNVHNISIFSQIRLVDRSVKTVHTNLFAKKGKLHKFVTSSSNFEKIDYFRRASSQNVHVYQFSSKSGY